MAELVGNTPLVRLRHIERDVPGVKLYAKLEYTNPGGSVKDRPALKIIQDAKREGRLPKGRTLLDATSGNTGVAYSIFGAALGVKVALAMPKNVTQARKDITQAFGTELIFSDPMEGSDGAIRLARKLAADAPEKYYYADQYSNPSNPRAHTEGTAQELIQQLGGEITHFVTGLGTTGTIMGTSRGLKAYSKSIRCVGLEPAEEMHGLEGLKHMASSIVPPVFNPSELDEVRPIGTEAGWDMADRLAEEEGLHVGHSSGANVAGALEVAKEAGQGCVVTIACDRGDRYFAPMKWEKHYEW